MNSERPDEGKVRNISEASKIVSNDVLTDWNAELCKEKETAVSAPTRVAEKSARLTQKPESKGTKDPSSSQIREAGQPVKPSKKGDSGKTTTGTPKRDVREKPPGKKSAPKDGSERQSTSATTTPHGKDEASTQMVANIAEILKDSFASLSQSMSEGFDNLGQMFQGSRSACVSQESRLLDDLSSADSDVSEVEEPAAKRPKSDEAGQSAENELILGQLEKDFDLAEHKGAEINTNLAAIVSKLLKEKTEEDKLTEIKKRNPAPKNCERLAETRVNLPIWNNLSEKARSADIKLQKVQKSLVKGATAVVSVVNNLITAPGMPSKNEVVNNLMDGVFLLANANMELNVRRREALRPELHASYRYLCAPSNPISSELFGDDLPKAVKDITDTNRITSKLQRDKKESYRRGRQPERLDKFQRKRNYSGAKNYHRPSQYKGEGKRKVQKSQP